VERALAGLGYAPWLEVAPYALWVLERRATGSPHGAPRG
jgi:hypothetical protein